MAPFDPKRTFAEPNDQGWIRYFDSDEPDPWISGPALVFPHLVRLGIHPLFDAPRHQSRSTRFPNDKFGRQAVEARLRMRIKNAPDEKPPGFSRILADGSQRRGAEPAQQHLVL